MAVWWLQLGIRPERIQPGRPSENGRHERMHRTLKQDTTRPPESNLAEQQKAFDAFRKEYNEERPHAALDQQPPKTIYQNSPREFTGRLREPEYPPWWEIRRVRKDGSFCWSKTDYFLGSVLARQSVGLEPAGDGLWRLWLFEYELGFLDEDEGRVRGVPRPLFEGRSGRPSGSLLAPQVPDSPDNV